MGKRGSKLGRTLETTVQAGGKRGGGGRISWMTGCELE